jgi:hypothetical protein
MNLSFRGRNLYLRFCLLLSGFCTGYLLSFRTLDHWSTSRWVRHLISPSGNRTRYYQKTRARQTSPGLLDHFLDAKSWIILFSVMLEQRHVIRFFVKEQNCPKEIHRRLKAVYFHRAMKRTQVYWWVSEVQQGHEGVTDSSRPGRSREIRIDEILAHRLERDPHATAQKLVYSLGYCHKQ